MNADRAHLPPRTAALVVALVLAAACGRAVYVALPVNSDASMFVYAGKLVAEGGRPGVDFLDNKLPSVGLLMSTPYRLLGAQWSAYGLLGLSLSLGASFVLARVARRLWGETAGSVTLVGSAAWMNFPPLAYGPLQLEVIQVFLAAVAGACVLQWLRTADWRDAATAGLCVGVAMWAKPTAAAVLPAAVVAMAAARGRQAWGGITALGVAAAVPVALVAWLVVISGAGEALPETLRQLRAYAAGSTFDAMDAAKPVMVLLAFGFPCLIVGFVYRRARQANAVGGVDVLFVLLWLAAETAAVVSQRRMYAYHFLVLAPPAALAAALFGRQCRAAMLATAFGPVVAIGVVWTATLLPAVGVPNRMGRVVAYFERHTVPDDAVWVDDYCQAVVETGRRPASAVPLLFLMANGDDAPAFFADRLLADFDRTRPACVVLHADLDRVADLYRHHMAETAHSPRRGDAVAAALQRLGGYVRERYRPEAAFDGVQVWRRDDARTAGATAAVGE